VRLTYARAKFNGSTGSYLVSYNCDPCKRDFNLLFTEDMFLSYCYGVDLSRKEKE